MRILSWNVQGLGGSLCRRYRGRLRQDLRKCIVGGDIDMMLIQEHHLSDRRISRYGCFLPGNWEMFWSAAYGPMASQGGVCIAVQDKYKSWITQKQVIIPGRAQYMVFQDEVNSWGLLNVYAPNHVSARIKFWQDILQALPQVDNWCVAGDFNMLEDPADRCGGSTLTISGQELANWERLSLSLRISDAWHLHSFSKERESLSFSRSDRRLAGANLSRIDRFYVSDSFADKGGSIKIMSGTVFSDHAPVILTLANTRNKQSFHLKIPEDILVNEQYSEQVHKIWIESFRDGDRPEMSLANAIMSLSRFFREAAMQQRQAYKAREKRMRHALISLQRLQEKYPSCGWVAHKIALAMGEIQQIQDVYYKFQYYQSNSKWTQVGNKGTGEFFRITRPSQSHSSVKHLRTENGEIISDHTQMRQLASNFYSHLLSAEAETDDIISSRNQVWGTIQKRVSHHMNEALNARLVVDELREALESLSKHNCLGQDGLTPTFFLKYWDLMKFELCAAFQRILDMGQTPKCITNGLIYLIPKGDGPSEDIRKWRPITILNTSYKILAKAISRRLQGFMPEIIHASQTGFIKQRSIFDNIFTFWEATSLAMKQNQKLAVLLLDFEKAYDRVDWNFLEGTMLCLEFDKSWIFGISALYRNAYSRVILAGDVGNSFLITRSVRQGCPLAPFLYLFFTEALHTYINAQVTGIRGLIMPSSEEEILDAEFADDTTLYLDGDISNLNRARSSLSTFCCASGAFINWCVLDRIWSVKPSILVS